MFCKGQSTKSLCLALYMVVTCTEDQLRHNSGMNIGLGSYACYTCILLLRFGKFTIWNPQLSLLSYTTILNFNHNAYKKQKIFSEKQKGFRETVKMLITHYLHSQVKLHSFMYVE